MSYWDMVSAAVVGNAVSLFLFIIGLLGYEFGRGLGRRLRRHGR